MATCYLLTEAGEHLVQEQDSPPHAILIENCVHEPVVVTGQYPADPLWMEWWQNEAERQRKKAQAVAQLEAGEPQTEDAPVKFELVKRKRAVLSTRALAGIQDAQNVDDLERLALTLRRAERRILREMIARYERERDEEEAIELLLLH